MWWLLLAALPALAAEHRGTVTYGGLPVPGATVTAERMTDRRSTVTGEDGTYLFADLPGGTWRIRVEMQLFEPQSADVAVAPGAAPAAWQLQPGSLPPAAAEPQTAYQRVEAAALPAKAKPKADPAPPDPELSRKAEDGLLINGSVNNGASSPFALLPAFGNNRRGQRSLYNGSAGFILNHSALDARNYSLTGQDTPKPGYARFQALLAFGGPLKIPKLLERGGPMLTLNYQWTRNSNAVTQTGLMPTVAERATPGIDPRARALLELFPLPNFAGSSRYNYQVALVNGLHQDDLQVRANKQRRRNFFNGSVAWQSTRTGNTDLFGFLDTGSVSGINTTAGYRRTISPRAFVNLGLNYSRLSTRVVPYFSGRRNVSGEAGITGNNQDPVNWGPPNLTFASGITPLIQPQAAFDRDQTAGVSADGFFIRRSHNLSYGGNWKRQQFNQLSQQDARGTFVFSGDFSGFLRGVPDASSIAFGNADKYLRGSIQELFFNDDWRVNPGLTINAGLRWEYWSPVSEKYGRLVNLDVTPGFRSAIAGSTLPRPDRNNVSPRIGVSWRPFAASSMVVRAGYGIYYDTSVYRPIAGRMSQQAPLSRSLRLSNSAQTPLTLADGFPSSPAAAGATLFGVDPDFRTGYAQTWQLSIQRDLPFALQLSATYDGSKGTRAQQQFLPNTFPDRAVNPSGFAYLVSNGNSSRQAGQLQVRRRMRSGFTANLTWTWAKAIDNAALGGRGQSATLIAQDWTDLRAERARSSFDQRHLVSASASYTPWMKGKVHPLLREWTIGTQGTWGTGLPLTPVILRPVSGTGFTGSIRPDYTGADVAAAPAGLFLNPAAFAPAPPGRWGNAGRNSIQGPRRLSVDISVARTFRAAERISYDFRLEAANALNTVTFPSWNTVAGSAQFGLPNSANAMRTVQAIVRARF